MWLHETSTRERRTLLAGFLGYAVDGFDFMVYSFVIPALLTAWNMTRAEAGYIATAGLLTSAAGTAASYALAIAAAWALPETRGRELVADTA